MNPFYPIVAKRALHRCEYCRAPEIIFNIPFEVDHIIPVSKQGANDPTNLALSCRACNLRKSNLTNAIDQETKEVVPLFNPRIHKWHEHFEADLIPPYRLLGKTAVGRVTIAQLALNRPEQLVARHQWIILDLFP